MPTLTQLEYIVTVEKLKHFGKAAQECHVSQPSLSAQIKKVEEEVGIIIFDRVKKPIIASQKGEIFIAQAKVILREHKKLMEISRSQEHVISGDLRLGIIPTLAPYLLPLFLGDFSKRYPKVKLKIDELKTESIIRELKEDTLDMALLATPLHEPALTEHLIFNEPFLLYVNKNNPLNQKTRVKESDLDLEQMWLLQDGHCLRNQVIKVCGMGNASTGVFPNIVFEGGNLETLRNLVKMSPGYSLFPWLFVQQMSSSEQSAFVREFESPVPARQISLVYRRGQWKSQLIEAMESSIRKCIPDELRTSKKRDIIPI